MQTIPDDEWFCDECNLQACAACKKNKIRLDSHVICGSEDGTKGCEGVFHLVRAVDASTRVSSAAGADDKGAAACVMLAEMRAAERCACGRLVLQEMSRQVSSVPAAPHDRLSSSPSGQHVRTTERARGIHHAFPSKLYRVRCLEACGAYAAA